MTPTTLDVSPNTGGREGDWFYEEDQRESRFGMRVVEHLHSEQTEFQKLDLYRSAFHGRFLTLDNVLMFTERDEFVYHEMLTHVPMATLAAARSALVIGGGDCGCIRELLRHPGLERIVQCEIDQRVTRVCMEHFDWATTAAEDPRVELIFADGIEYVARQDQSFDLIVIDSTDPVGPAAGLFSTDFYISARHALRPGGVLTAQTETPFWYAQVLGTIHASLRGAFSNVHCYLGAVPSYPSGTWSWAWASDLGNPLERFELEHAARVAGATRYFNADIARASFALPNFVRDAIRL